jgi:CBS domain-containing protein
MKVRDLMTTNVATVERSATLKDVAAILAERRISGLPVVDAAGHVLGVVSEADIVQKEAIRPRRAGGLLRRLGVHDGRTDAKLAARTAGEAMTSPALTIGADRAVAEAASLMVEKGVKRLPVVAGEKLAGIVTRADLVRAFIRPDEQIAREIREEVALGTFAIAPENLHVEVVDGEVTLGGEVDTPEVVSLLAEFVKRVAGVVAVHSHLTARTDRELSERL